MDGLASVQIQLFLASISHQWDPFISTYVPQCAQRLLPASSTKRQDDASTHKPNSIWNLIYCVTWLQTTDLYLQSEAILHQLANVSDWNLNASSEKLELEQYMRRGTQLLLAVDRVNVVPVHLSFLTLSLSWRARTSSWLRLISRWYCFNLCGPQLHLFFQNRFSPLLALIRLFLMPPPFS